MQQRTQNTQHRRAKRRGAMLVFVAVLLMVFVGIIAFSVDVAYMHLSRTQLKTSTDAAARAAGEALSRTQDITLSQQAAKRVARRNRVDGARLLLRNSDVETGRSVKQANGKWVFTPGGTPVNGFRITGQKTVGSRSGPVNLFFAPIFGIQHYEVTAKAASVRFDRDIAIVVDRSSSMKLYLNENASGMSIYDWRVCAVAQPQSRWVALADAVDVFLAELDNTAHKEHVGLASYASNFSICSIANLIAQINQQLSANSADVSNAMDAITNSFFNGNTAIGEGIRRGNDILTNTTYARPYALKTMVLMTDGVHNTGVSPQTAAQEAKNLGIVIYTVTFGDSANQTAMQDVATITGGKHYHAPDAQALTAAFKEIALSLSVILTQ